MMMMMIIIIMSQQRQSTYTASQRHSTASPQQPQLHRAMWDPRSRPEETGCLYACLCLGCMKGGGGMQVCLHVCRGVYIVCGCV